MRCGAREIQNIIREGATYHLQCSLEYQLKICSARPSTNCMAHGTPKKMLTFYACSGPYISAWRHWCSGNIEASQALAPGSIPGWRIIFVKLRLQGKIMLTQGILAQLRKPAEQQTIPLGVIGLVV